MVELTLVHQPLIQSKKQTLILFSFHEKQVQANTSKNKYLLTFLEHFNSPVFQKTPED
jgi:hypothetical protein